MYIPQEEPHTGTQKLLVIFSQDKLGGEINNPHSVAVAMLISYTNGVYQR